MHGAPSVSYPVGRSPWAGAIALAAWALGVAATLAWASSAADARRLSLGGAACAVAGVLALAGWWRQRTGQLGWDGARWSWSPGDLPALDGGAVRAVLDLQAAMLLRFECADGVRWLWLDRYRLPGRWAALRRAVYSPAADQAPSGATPPARP